MSQKTDVAGADTGNDVTYLPPLGTRNKQAQSSSIQQTTDCQNTSSL
jgi:hypothetical protein